VISPCPKCGRQPELRELFKYAWTEPVTRQSILLLKYSCRRLFGLLTCFDPCEYHWIEKGWFDVGHREAVRKWNEAARGHQ
jgi:hypothetical protein